LAGITIIAALAAGCGTQQSPAPTVAERTEAPSGSQALASATVPSASPPTASQSTAATVAPTSGPLVSAWARTEIGPQGTSCDNLNVVDALGGVVVTCGVLTDLPMAWRSGDGATWNPLLGLPGPIVRSDGTDRGGLALTCDRTVTDQQYCVHGSIWQSSEGATWRRASVDGLPPATFFEDVAANDGLLVALADQQFQCDGKTPLGARAETSIVLVDTCTGPVERQLFFRSPDGNHWIRDPLPPNHLRPPLHQTISRVWPAGTGFVATGLIWAPNDPEAPGTGVAAWTSADGVTWSAATIVPGAFVGNDVFLIGWPPGYVLIGSTLDSSTAVWSSTDGRTWTRGPNEDSLASSVMVRLFAVDGGLVGYGWGGADNAAILWRSADGVSWERAGTSPTCSGGSAVLRDRTLVVVGADDIAGQIYACTGSLAR
jgi:hypothetical protein